MPSDQLAIIRTKHYDPERLDVVGLHPIVHRPMVNKWLKWAKCNNKIEVDGTVLFLVYLDLIDPLIRAGTLMRCKRCWGRT